MDLFLDRSIVIKLNLYYNTCASKDNQDYLVPRYEQIPNYNQTGGNILCKIKFLGKHGLSGITGDINQSQIKLNSLCFRSQNLFFFNSALEATGEKVSDIVCSEIFDRLHSKPNTSIRISALLHVTDSEDAATPQDRDVRCHQTNREADITSSCYLVACRSSGSQQSLHISASSKSLTNHKQPLGSSRTQLF